MSKRFVFAVSLLALTTACNEEVGLIDEDRNFGGRGGNASWNGNYNRSALMVMLLR